MRYLAEITETVRGYHAETERLADGGAPGAAARGRRRPSSATATEGVAAPARAGPQGLPHEVADQIAGWPAVVASYSGDEQVVQVRDKEIVTQLTRESLSRQQDPARRAAAASPTTASWCRFWRRENLPGFFPFTAGVFPFKRDGEDPARMFAGEGDPSRTNRRFKLLSADGDAKRLSTAFDSVTLYGRDPDPRPDIYGKVGTSGRLGRDARRHEGALRRLRPGLARRPRCR